MIPFIIAAIENENDRAFMEMVYREYYRLMYSEALKIVRDTWSAENVVQSALEKLINCVDQLQQKDRDHLINYVISTCKNTAFDYLRKEKRFEAVSSLDEFDGPAAFPSDMNLEEKLIHNDEISRLQTIWNKLSPKTQYLLEGRYVLEKTSSEIAQELGIKTDSVRMALSRARREAYSLMTQGDSDGD